MSESIGVYGTAAASIIAGKVARLTASLSRYGHESVLE